MTAPREEQPPAPTDGPSVSTAPPRARWNLRFGRVPSHIGPARTSTLVLAVLFVAVFALWLYVRPPSAQVGTAGSVGGGSGRVEQTTPSTRATTASTTRPPTRSSTPTRSSPSAPTTTAPGAATTTRTKVSATSGRPTTTSAGTAPVPPQPSSTVAPSS